MAKGLPGYPSNKNLQRQAAQLAGGAVPTKRSIRRQYALPIQSNQGFTEALIHLLQQGGGATSAGFDQAIASQQGIDQAAAARLAALGGPYGAGSAAAVGGMGGSALSSLVAQGAAAKNYAGQMPAVAASRGQQMNAQLVQQRNQALTQRGEDYRSALQQALQTVQQNALAMSSLRSSNKNAAMDRVLQQQSMAQNQAQFEASQAQNAAQFAVEHDPKYLRFVAGLQNNTSPSASGQPPWTQYGLTANEWQTKAADLVSGAQGAAAHRIPISKFISEALTKQLPAPLVLITAARIYAGFRNAPAGSSGAAAFQSYQKWMQNRAWARYQRYAQNRSKQPGYRSAPPGSHGPGR